MDQREVDALAGACRSQGMTWSQTNFSVSIVRNEQSKERTRCADICRRAMPQPVKNWAEAQIVEALRLVLEQVQSPAKP